MTTPATPAPVHYLPIGTTVISAAFFAALLYRASRRHWPPHLVWWAIGVFAYGLGTAIESSITLFGNTPELTRWWYWAGAILGGYPLATGSVYLLHKRRTAHILTFTSLALVIAASVGVFLTPLNLEALEPHRPDVAVIDWDWLGIAAAVINTYAILFLVGGAIYSSAKFFVAGDNPRRAVGTALIAAGALMPGFGGAMARAGIVEALYVGEFCGIIIIWVGYEFCIRAPRPARANSVTK